MEQLVKQASASPNANALTSVLVEATSHLNLFAFSQFLALPNLLQVLLSPIIIVGASVYRFYTFNEYYFIDFCFHSFSMTLQLQVTENSVYLDMLRLFAHGTWSDYKRMFARMKLKGIDGVHTSRGAFGLIRCKVKNLTRA
ncbi:hypothetical protein JHK82_026059 [Glycine max]|nr:hypothetical protein JHK85_026668 [Glycine max]KAG5134871.1 hypothetical protein JHK82_026059 [Glycine max]